MTAYKKPNLFIVGAPRSGTTSLKNWLSQHPDIFMAELEPNFFALDIEGKQDRIRAIREYLSLFSKASTQRYIGEKSPRYLFSRDAAKNIKAFNPNAKILIILRNPMEMLYSWYRHLRRHGLETEPDFISALRKEGERKKKYGFSIIRDFYYTETVKYYSQVKRFIDCFGKRNVKVLILDEVEANHKAAYNEVLAFLKLQKFQPEFAILNIGHGEPKSNFIAKLLFFFQHLPLQIRRFIKIFIPVGFGGKLRAFNVGSDNFSSDLASKEKVKLNKIFKSDIIKLEKLIGKNLSRWYS